LSQLIVKLLTINKIII